MMWLEKKLPVSVNRRLINKNEREDKLAFSQGWESYDATIEELAGAIAHGYAFCAQMSGQRKASNFQTCGFVAVDIDEGTTLDAVESVEIVRESASMIYTTASHRQDAHRFRIVFAMELPITDPKEYSAVLRSLALRVGGDKAATDPARIFYGNTSAELQLFDRGLSATKVQELIDQSFGHSGWETRAETSERKTSVSLAQLETGQIVIASDGTSVAYDDLEPRSPIFCPFHHDQSPSAFIVVSQRGVKGIHCSACATSYWPPRLEDHDFYSFEKAVDANNKKMKAGTDDENTYVDALLPYITRPENIRVTNEKFVSSVNIEPGITFIKSPKGSGKTEFLNQITKQKGKSILLIGHRRALIGQMCPRLGLDSYLDDEGETRANKRRYGISLDSIQTVSLINKYDYVIIDESEQVLAHLLSDTLSAKRKRIFVHLQHIIKNAVHVIALDADCGWISFLNISQWACSDNPEKHISIYMNKFVSRGTPIKLYHEENSLVGDMVRSVDNGQKIYVTSNSKRVVDSIYANVSDKYKNKKYLIVTSETTNSQEVIKFLANPSESAKDYDAIFASPSISTGVDITFADDERVFDVVYGVFKSEITNHFECDQQLSRVRHPKEVKVHVSPRRFFYDASSETIMNDVVLSEVMEHLLTGYDEFNRPIFDRKDELLQLVTSIVAQNRASMNDLKRNFVEYKRHQGCQIIDVDTDSELAEAGRLTLKKGKQLSEEQYVERVTNADKLNHRQFNDIQVRYEAGRSLSDEETASYQRAILERFYRTDISSDLIKIDARGKFREAVSRYEMLTDKYASLIWNYRRADAELRSVTSDSYKDRLSQVEFIRDALELMGWFHEAEFAFDQVHDSRESEALVKFLTDNKERYEIAFGEDVRRDYKTKPFAQIGVILKKIGMGLNNQKTSSQGKTFYRHRIDENKYNFIRDIVERRRGKKEIGLSPEEVEWDEVL